MTTTTTNKQTISSSAPLPPLPPRRSQEGWTPSDAERRIEPAAEKGTSVIDASVDELATNDPDVGREEAEPTPNEPVVSPNHVPNTIPERDPNFDFYTFLAEQEQKKKSVSVVTAALLKQNKFLIQQLTEQNKFTIDRLIAPPLLVCAACGAAKGQASGGSKKKVKKETKEEKEKKSKSWVPERIVPSRISRVVTLSLLVVIVMQLSFLHGEIAERYREGDRDGTRGRKVGFFGW